MQIQSPEACDLFASFPVPGYTVSFCFSDSLRQEPYRSGLLQNTPADTLQRVSLTEVPGQPHESWFARWSDGNILAHMNFIAFLMEALKELPLGHGLPDDLIYIATDQPPPSGALLLFGSPFAVLLGFSGVASPGATD